MGLRAALPENKSREPVRAKEGGRVSSQVSTQHESLQGALTIAEEKGLLKGRRTLMIRESAPEKLVVEAKRKTGITSGPKLLETTLTNIIAADDYAEWLYSQRGTVDPSLDLEF